MVYIDPLMPCTPRPDWPHRKSCHLFADTEQELIAFARQCNFRDGLFHHNTYIGSYYLLNWSRAWWAIFCGAKRLTARQTVRKRHEIWPELKDRPKVTEQNNVVG